MFPQLFGIVKSFGLLLALSFLAGIYLTIKRGKERGMSEQVVSDLCFGVLLSSIIGVRLFYVVTHLSEFSPWYEAFYIWQGGLTLYGGIIAAILTVFYLSKKYSIDFLVVADVMAPQVLLGIGLTRIGCLLNGCCFGEITSLQWGVHFPDSCAAGYFADGNALHPTQIYSSLLGFVGWLYLIKTDNKPDIAGFVFSRFLIVYGVSRLLVDFFRHYEASATHIGGLVTSQYISLALIILGSALTLFKLRNK